MRWIVSVCAGLALFAQPVTGQNVPTPEEHIGITIGADRALADWDELTSYYEALARGSDRVTVDTLGLTTAGRPFVMLTITSPENHSRIEELHEIQMKLADPRRITGPAERERLVEQGRTVVLITHGIHATEVGGSQTAARLAHRLASSMDPAVLEILDEVILIQIPSLNPDGLQWIVDWYERFVGTPFEGAPLPWLYHYYVGHDNNRDWYAFTQAETELTVTGAHNAWHPQIVHDIHQMGGSGARIFFPPYIDPWEPNIDPALTSSVSQLGTYMAAELTAQGKAGVVVNATYDAFTPARAYQHYHAGARILSETASARLASPVTVEAEALRGGRGYDAGVASWNFPRPWPGGAWGLPDIVDYMDAGAMALLTNAAKNRRYWLESFVGIGERAVAKWPAWPEAWVLPSDQPNPLGLASVVRILTLGDVEVQRATEAFTAGGERFGAGSYVISMHQPYAAFAQTMLERQRYPDLREYPGGPPRRPYDVTAHTLPLLMDVEAVPLRAPPSVNLSDPVEPPEPSYRLPAEMTGDQAPRVGLYKSWQEPMEAGWTRWLFDEYELPYDTLHDADVRAGNLVGEYDVIFLQDQGARSILEGFGEGVLPAAYTGGLGEEGARALRDFVQNGGRIVAVEGATEFVVDLFDLGVSSAVERLPTTDFYIPGSLLSVEVTDAAFGAGLNPRTAAWYWNSSRAFDLTDPAVRVLARYDENPLLSGWVLGPEYIAGKPAVVEADIGLGSVTLFGFQPNYRGQSIATWPMLFRALAGWTHTSPLGS